MVTIKGINMGAGVPKICVPIIEKNEQNILAEAARIKNASCDVVEWRIDFFEDVFCDAKMLDVLPKLKSAIGEEKILLVTFRTKIEGGQLAIEVDRYKKLLSLIVDSGYADIVDVELSIGETVFKELVQRAKKNQCYVIASSHDFEKTPSCETMVNKLVKMNELGADISKLAVMPNCMEDVATLLQATSIMKDKYKDITVVTMSMGQIGAISRVAGEIFGSAMTFGIIDKPSAPGQVEVNKLQQIMNNINEL